MFYWWIFEALEHVAVFLFDAAAKVSHHGHDGACDDDFYDRISRRYSVILLVIFTMLVSTKQYVGEPIACFCPAHFTGTHVEYTNNICWVSNSYFVSFDRLLPKYPDPKTEQFIYFYQYVPFILVTQAVFFYIPSLIWSTLNTKSGYDLGMLVTQARITDTYTSDIRETSVQYLARYIDRILEYHRQKRIEYFDQLRSIKYSTFLSFLIRNDHMTMCDNHLMWSFLLTKILYLLNALGQLYLLNLFLGNDYHMYGFAVIRSLFRGNNENWTVIQRFELQMKGKTRTYLCNFAVRNLADNIHTYTVQCSLPINLFNEKIFLIIWFWLYFTTLFTLFGFIYWIISFFYPKFYKSNLIRYLSSMKRINIHHFPEDPFQEPPVVPHRHHSHSHRRRHQSFVHSHYSSMHITRHHHNLVSSYTNRTLKTSIDSNRLPRIREHCSIPISDGAENIESSVTPTSDEQSRPSTPEQKLLEQSNSISISHEHNRIIKNFLTDYLGHDGTLVLYLLKMNTNEVITGEIVTTLFELFKTNYQINATD
ncbi:unnamed protein product [Rotaria sp. Silwood2]|nr:unnamed protein product [Rotaria sp. Silwood2]CAF2560266.1 unnamed protein product [Rotaria sp. Silwood2]CAF4144212.1 unnamed protein product [Rotaria sp. Silwood2]CAF4224706.1 unnamed protein product [Rotaria sp. Silwood2]